MKRVLILLFITTLLVACTTKPDPNEEDFMPIICESNQDNLSISSTATLSAETLWTHSTECSGLIYQNGTITYAEDATEATLKTGVFALPSYLELVPSWNIEIDDDVKVRIRIIPSDNPEETSFLMGYWTADYKMSMPRQDSDLGTAYIDTYIANEPSQFVSFEVTFEGGSFALKNLSVTTKPSATTFDDDTSVLEEVSVSVPTKHQMGIPVIGSSICSPTSLAMVLSYYDHDMTPETSAGLVYDQGSQIYGNWSFNASFAGGYEGLYSRVEYLTSLQTIYDYLSNDIPLVLSIKTTAKEELEGALMAYPSGHLIVLTGLKQIDGVWYGLVNDPAEYTDDNVPREYRLDQLLDAMRNYAYIIQSSPFTN